MDKKRKKAQFEGLLQKKNQGSHIDIKPELLTTQAEAMFPETFNLSYSLSNKPVYWKPTLSSSDGLGGFKMSSGNDLWKKVQDKVLVDDNVWGGKVKIEPFSKLISEVSKQPETQKHPLTFDHPPPEDQPKKVPRKNSRLVIKSKESLTKTRSEAQLKPLQSEKPPKPFKEFVAANPRLYPKTGGYPP